MLNLSIGGPDFADQPFTEKVDELAANGVIIVSAIGNDGPLWGTLNNPGDMMAVVGVGGAEPNGEIAPFSSRGMTMHELDAAHASYGRVKPDLVTYGRSLIAPSNKSPASCRKLSGTSVASPVVAGAIVLLASTVPEERRRAVVNPASVKRALVQSAHRLRHGSVYEQGAGLLSIEDAYEVMKVIDAEFVDAAKAVAQRDMIMAARQRLASDGEEDAGSSGVKDVPYTVPGPKAAFFPAFYDLTAAGCPHMWPHCAQPLFRGALPVTLNVTVLNPGGVQGRVEDIVWRNGVNGEYLQVKVTPPRRFWPWAAGMGIHISVKGDPKFNMHAEGTLHIRVVSVHELTHSDIQLPIKVDVIPTPKREYRLLWDTFHSVRYPPGYVPRDNLAETKDMLDWLGDHPHTNFHMLLRSFLRAGFYVDILDSPISCLSAEDLSQYGGLIILDSEDYFSVEEIATVSRLVSEGGLALIVAAEWYNLDVMRDIRFEDDNTRSWWSPITAGGNVPALNELLAPFDIALGETVVSGQVTAGGELFRFESGVPIVSFPPNGELLFVSGMQLSGSKKRRQRGIFPDQRVPDLPILGLTKARSGAVLLYGDTNCIDTAYSGARCYNLFVKWVRHVITKCTLSRDCDKMLAESRIVPDGIQPMPGSLLVKATPPSRSVFELFKPHSKLLARQAAYGGLRQIEQQKDAVCEFRYALQTDVRSDDSGRSQKVIFPPQRRAVPLGSERKYFQVLESRWTDWMHSRFRNESYGRNGDSSSEGKAFALFSFHARVRPLYTILKGLALIAISFLVRYRKSLLFYARRLRKVSMSRSGQSLISQTSSQSADYVIHISRTVSRMVEKG